MGYKMKGSPAKLGKIQGTSGHASALKQMSEFELGKEAESIMRDLKDFAAGLEEDKMKDSSEKTKRLRGETKLQDWKTEEWRKRSERLADEKGIFTGKRKSARKYKKSQKKEDKLRRELEKSERYDQMSPEEKQIFDDERSAKLLAMFHGNAGAMRGIAQQQYNRMLQKNAKRPSTLDQVQVKNKISSKTNLGDSNRIYTHQRYNVAKGFETGESTLGKIIDSDNDLDKKGKPKGFGDYERQWKEQQSNWGKR